MIHCNYTKAILALPQKRYRNDQGIWILNHEPNQYLHDKRNYLGKVKNISLQDKKPLRQAQKEIRIERINQ